MSSQTIKTKRVPLEVGDWIKVYANQGMRDAQVLAINGTQALVEYHMPSGTTALRIIAADGTSGWGQKVSYFNVPYSWLFTLLYSGMEWTCNPQQLYDKKPITIQEAWEAR
jgi:hypothetical protein